MTDKQLGILKAIYLNKKRRDHVAIEMGITSKNLRPIEREAVKILLKEYMEIKGL